MGADMRLANMLILLCVGIGIAACAPRIDSIHITVPASNEEATPDQREYVEQMLPKIFPTGQCIYVPEVGKQFVAAKKDGNNVTFYLCDKYRKPTTFRITVGPDMQLKILRTAIQWHSVQQRLSNENPVNGK